MFKILNPFIYMINFFMYTAHLEGQRFCDEYEPYDFSNDIGYFKGPICSPEAFEMKVHCYSYRMGHAIQFMREYDQCGPWKDIVLGREADTYYMFLLYPIPNP